jgi:hypothetical protein
VSVSDLITLDYATAQLSAGGRVLTAAQTAAIPSKISEASLAVCRWCGDRDFTRQTYDETYRPSLEGTVDLRQIPVNGVSRVSGGRTVGLLVTNNAPTTNVRAVVAFTSTGDESTGLTFTGLTLTVTVGGVDTPATNNLTYAANPTLGQLAAAVDAAGYSWTATVPANLATWPSAELVGGDVGQDATGIGAGLNLYAEVVANCRLDRSTGELSVGIGGGSSTADSPRWGPYQDPADPAWDRARVRVIYDAGFDVIPDLVQQATALIVGKLLDDLTRELSIESEGIGRGNYTVASEGRTLFTTEVTSKLGLYRLIRT